MTARFRQATTAAFTIVCIFTASASAADPVIEKVRADWQEWEKSFDSFIMEWDDTVTYLAVQPPESRTAARRLVCDGVRIRQQRRGRPPHRDHPAADVVSDYVAVLAGTEHRKLFRTPEQPEHPTGFIGNEAGYVGGAANDYTTLAPLLAFFPSRTNLTAININEYKSTEDSGSIDGASCRILTRPSTATSNKRLWLATDDSRVLRLELIRKTTPIFQLTLAYAPDATGRLVCRSWKNVLFRQGQLVETLTADVRKIEVNVELDPQEFDLPFPPGTVVQDEVTSQTAVVREDGSFRTVSPGEMELNLPWKEYMQREPIPETLDFGRRSIGRERRFVWGGIAVLAAAGAAWAAKRYMHRRRHD